jgi:kynurenine formamidase
VDKGIHIIEVLDLEAIASDRIREFVFILIPLRLVGATGSPVRPLALVPR